MRALIVVALIALAGCSQSSPSEAAESNSAEATLDGVVVDAAVVPLPGANVSLQDGRWVLSDEEGRFAFEGLEPGFYVVRASKPGYFDGQANVEVRADATPSVRLLLETDAQKVAFWQSWAFNGFLECGTEGVVICAIPNYVMYDVLCLQADLCYGNLTQNNYIEYTWLDQQPHHAQSEMFWDSTQSLGSKMSLWLSWATRSDFAQGQYTDDFDGATGQSPVYAAVNRTLLEIAEIGPDTAYVVRVFAGDTLSVAQDFEVIHHMFYNYAPPDGWRFSESDGQVPEPPR